MKWLAPQTNIDKYLEKCEYYATNDWSNFKQDKDYGKILEGNEPAVGDIALSNIKRLNCLNILTDNLAKFKENETVGNPKLYNFDGMLIAPSTLRYINSVLEIKTLVANPKKIIEIGGGYGGLCKTMSTVFNWDSYKIVDLPAPVKLCNRYLKHFNLNAEAVEEIDEPCDLVIADSSMAECDLETQMKYVKLIKKAKFAYIVYNSLATDKGAEIFMKILLELLPSFDALIEHSRTSSGQMVSTVEILYLKR